MRFVFAIVAFVVAAVLIGVGIAERTIFLPPAEVTASVHVTSTAPISVIDAATMRAYPNHVQLKLGGSSKAFVAYARTDDVMGWVGEAAHNVISFDKKTGQLTSKFVDGAEKTVPNPAGSDLWLAEYANPLANGPYQLVRSASSKVSWMIVSDGTAAAPADVSLSWPVDNSTPWVVPLLLAGVVFLLLGLAFLLWAIAHLRRARGPRRRTPKMPKLPKQPRYRPSKRPKELPSGSRGRRSSRSSMIVAPLALAGIVALSGCTTPSLTVVPSPTPTAKNAAAVAADPPAVTELQAGRIVDRIAAVAASADKALDAKQLAERFAGPALALRTANYAIRKIDKSEPAVPTIQTHVRLVLPQQNAKWPRTVFVVVDKQDDTKLALIGMMLVQDDARSQYKVHYAVNLEPGSMVPKVNAPSTGTNRVPPESTLFTIAPDTVAAAYGDILAKDSASPSFSLFDPANDTLRPQVGLAAQKAQQKKLPKTAKLTFTNLPGLEPVIALATFNGGGVLVATTLDETQTVKPVQKGATVNAPGSIKALSGKAVSTKGITATYGDQLLFYVPAKTAEVNQIQLLGYGQGLISASEVKK